MRHITMPRMPSNWTGAARTFYETLCEALSTLAKTVKMSDLSDELQQKIENGGTSIEDTGWSDLELLGGASVWGNSDPCQIRRYGKTVFIRGGLKRSSVASGNTVSLATIPEGYRPSSRLELPSAYIGSNSDDKLVILVINADGDTLTLRNTNTAALSASKYINISCCYMID